MPFSSDDRPQRLPAPNGLRSCRTSGHSPPASSQPPRCSATRSSGTRPSQSALHASVADVHMHQLHHRCRRRPHGRCDVEHRSGSTGALVAASFAAMAVAEASTWDSRSRQPDPWKRMRQVAGAAARSPLRRFSSTRRLSQGSPSRMRRCHPGRSRCSSFQRWPCSGSIRSISANAGSVTTFERSTKLSSAPTLVCGRADRHPRRARPVHGRSLSRRRDLLERHRCADGPRRRDSANVHTCVASCTTSGRSGSRPVCSRSRARSRSRSAG